MILLLLLFLASQASAQTSYPSKWKADLATQPPVKAALGWLDSNFPRQVEEWIRITQIPAQSRHEQGRAEYIRTEVSKLGYVVAIDSIGNVTLRRPGSGGGPRVAFAAHLDVVHPLTTDFTVKRVGDTLRAPGVFDNSASVTNLLNVLRALDTAGVATKGDLIFIWTAQEELGLRGMDYWLEHNPRSIDMLVALNGGLGPVNYGALGIYWTRYFFRGAGSHTNTSAGKPHPARALAAAIRSIYEIKIPEEQGGAVYNVGMLRGGEIFNAIPREVSFTVDLRSVNPRLLDTLNREIEVRVAAAASAERVEWAKEEVQRNRAGGSEALLASKRAHPVVQTAIDIHRFLGIDIGPRGAIATGSTDANAGVVRDIPSISVGRSRGGDQHTLSEWSEISSALPATKMVLLAGVALAGVSDTPRRARQLP